jgi:hypothetical protein
MLTGMLAALTIRERWEEDHPEAKQGRDERFQAGVDRILWRYERERAARERKRG